MQILEQLALGFTEVTDSDITLECASVMGYLEGIGQMVEPGTLTESVVMEGLWGTIVGWIKNIIDRLIGLVRKAIGWFSKNLSKSKNMYRDTDGSVYDADELQSAISSLDPYSGPNLKMFKEGFGDFIRHLSKINNDLYDVHSDIEHVFDDIKIIDELANDINIEIASKLEAMLHSMDDAEYRNYVALESAKKFSSHLDYSNYFINYTSDDHISVIKKQWNVVQRDMRDQEGRLIRLRKTLESVQGNDPNTTERSVGINALTNVVSKYAEVVTKYIQLVQSSLTLYKEDDRVVQEYVNQVENVKKKIRKNGK